MSQGKLLVDDQGDFISVVQEGKDFEGRVLTAVKEHYTADKVVFVSNSNESEYGIRITTPDHEWVESIVLEHVFIY